MPEAKPKPRRPRVDVRVVVNWSNLGVFIMTTATVAAMFAAVVWLIGGDR
jgi:uncharacterized membrane protein